MDNASLDGIQSLSSEEMADFIAGIRTRKASTECNDDDDEDGAETETNEAEEDEEQFGRMEMNGIASVDRRKLTKGALWNYFIVIFSCLLIIL